MLSAEGTEKNTKNFEIVKFLTLIFKIFKHL